MAKTNKSLVQKEKAEVHRTKLAIDKAKRRSQPILDRGKPSIEEKSTILIYCEGQNTEPSYFRKFKAQTVKVQVFGEGRNTLSLVERAHSIVQKNEARGIFFDSVWCVFDADPKPDNPKQLENYNAAIVLAKKYGYEVAYSNQAFEYWLILHFEDHQGGAMNRKLYDEKLNSYLKEHQLSYDGTSNKIVTPELFNMLFEHHKYDNKGQSLTRTDLAIKRAEKIYDRLDHNNPGKEESSTTVFQLVKVLTKPFLTE